MTSTYPIIMSTKHHKPKRPAKPPPKKIKNEKQFPVKKCPKGHSVCTCH